jgi:hypothetical protein
LQLAYWKTNRVHGRKLELDQFISVCCQ